jgi:hypothetical protein
MAGEVIAHMKARVAQCRRLANATTDQRTYKVLQDMALEIEADIKRLDGRNGANPAVSRRSANGRDLRAPRITEH